MNLLETSRIRYGAQQWDGLSLLPMIYESKLLAIVIAAAYSAALLQSSEAQAKSRFTPYEARNSIVEGKGGTRTTKHGIEYWAMGDPPRRYRSEERRVGKEGGSTFKSRG